MKPTISASLIIINSWAFIAPAFADCHSAGTCHMWNEDNVAENLKAWLQGLFALKSGEETSSPFLEVESKTSSECYEASDIKRALKIEYEEGKFKKFVEVETYSKLDSPARLIFANDSILESRGFSKGFAHGQSTFVTADGNLLFQGLMDRGCFEGRVRGYDWQYRRLVYVGRLNHNSPIGPQWSILRTTDGSAVVGYLYRWAENMESFPTDLKKHFSGTNIVFIYPDLNTTLIGSYNQDGTMETLQQTTLMGERTNQWGVKELKVSDEKFGPIFKRDMSTETHISHTPLLRDPYEAVTVDVRQSSLPIDGQGLFAVRNVTKLTVLAFYNGVRVTRDYLFNVMFSFQKKSPYLIETEDTDVLIDIPKEYRNWNKYRASSGHKVNHNKKNNIQYFDCEHPRFGKILCVVALEDISAGSELFGKYSVIFNDDHVKGVISNVLNVGHLLYGGSKRDFATKARPYVDMIEKVTSYIDIEDIMNLFGHPDID